MEWFDGASPENLVKDLNFVNEFHRDVAEASRKLSNVGQHHIKIVTQGRVRDRLKSLDHSLQNQRVSVSIHLVDDLILSLEVDGAAHQDQTCVESVFVGATLASDQVGVGALNHTVLDAFVFAGVVDGHVAEDAEAKLCDLVVTLFKDF